MWNVGNAGEVVSEYAYPWDIFSDDFETTIRVFCQEEAANIEIGNGNENHIIWHEALLSGDEENDTWETLPLSGEKTLDGNSSWILGSAHLTKSFSADDLKKRQYVAVYQCDFVQGQWKCGCRDNNDSCLDNGDWSLQAFQRQSHSNLTSLADPVLTLSADPDVFSSLTSPYKSVLFWNTENIGADWTCTAEGGWSGEKDPLGSTIGEQVEVSETTSFTLSCVDPSGIKSATDTIRIVVQKPLSGEDTCLSDWGLAFDQPFIGDMNGDGVSEIGVKRDGEWFFDLNNNGKWDDCGVEGCVSDFGIATDEPVVGDWNGDGKDEIGVKRGKQWLLDRNGDGEWNGCATDTCVLDWGVPYDLIAIGDMNGDGKDEVGVHRQQSEHTNDAWLFDANNNGEWNGCERDLCFPDWGIASDTAFTGDWNGDGKDEIGVRRGIDWFFDSNGNGQWDACDADSCSTDASFSEKIPLIGDWDENGKDEIGTWKNGEWSFDFNSNNQWDGCSPVRDDSQ